MLTKICGRCGKKYSSKRCTACEARRQKQYDRMERNEERAAFYHSNEWQTLTKMCKARSHGIDLYEYHKSGRLTMGRLSHHIIPIEDDMSRALDIDNLIWVSDKSHKAIHDEYNKSEIHKQKAIDFLKKICRGSVKKY